MINAQIAYGQYKWLTIILKCISVINVQSLRSVLAKQCTWTVASWLGGMFEIKGRENNFSVVA